MGKLPRHVFEDELVPLFEKAGPIYEMRLMMDFSGSNRGFGFVQFTTSDDARRSITLLDNFEIRRGKRLYKYLQCLSLTQSENTLFDFVAYSTEIKINHFIPHPSTD